MNKSSLSRRVSMLLVLGFYFGAVIASADTLAYWVGPTGMGGNGNWSTAADWSGGVVPNNGAGNTYSVTLPGYGCSTFSCYAVSLDMSPTIDNLTIEFGATLQTSLQPQTLAVGSITNAGSISLDSNSVNVAGKVSNTRAFSFAESQIAAPQYVQTGSFSGTLPTQTNLGLDATMNVANVTVSGGILDFEDATGVTHDTLNGNLVMDGGSFAEPGGVLNGNLTFTAASTYSPIICQPAHCGALAVSGDATLAGTIDLGFEGTFSNGETIDLMTYLAETGLFENVVWGGLDFDQTVTLDYTPTELDAVVHGNAPEPASLLLLGTGLLALVYRLLSQQA